ncbi:unnamed protein product [Prunus armeniaca]
MKKKKEKRRSSSSVKVPDLVIPCSAWLRLETPPHAFPAPNVQLAKQPTASGDSLPPRSDAREGMPLKTLIRKICLGGSRRLLGGLGGA